MKSFVPSLIVLGLAAVLSFGGAKPSPVVDVPAVIEVAASPSPLCDCEPCKCDKCECSPIASPLVVGPPPEVVSLVAAEPVFTRPQVLPVKPAPLMPLPQPTKDKQTIGTALVSPPARSSCGPGGCGVRRGLFGRRR